jgi:uncharacterized protein YcbX
VNSVGTVEDLWRYPVKSMAGERLTQAPVDVRGILGDRLYAIQDTDGKLGGGTDTRRFVRMDGLLDFQAAYLPDLTPVITLPDGRVVRGDNEHVHWAVSDGLDRRGVTLVREDVISHFDGEPLHLATTASMRLADLTPDRRRVRPNMVLRTQDRDDRPEETWVGRELRIGAHLVIVVVGTRQPLGVSARVAIPGRVRVGDEVLLG